MHKGTVPPNYFMYQTQLDPFNLLLKYNDLGCQRWNKEQKTNTCKVIFFLSWSHSDIYYGFLLKNHCRPDPATARKTPFSNTQFCKFDEKCRCLFWGENWKLSYGHILNKKCKKLKILSLLHKFVCKVDYFHSQFEKKTFEATFALLIANLVQVKC